MNDFHINLGEEGREQIKKKLKRTIAIKHFYGRTYFFLSNWFYVISWTIAVITPFMLASILYVPELNHQFGLWSLIITGVGTLLSLIRTVFRFSQKAKHQFAIRENAQYLFNKITFGLISDAEIIDELRKLDISEINDPAPE